MLALYVGIALQSRLMLLGDSLTLSCSPLAQPVIRSAAVSLSLCLSLSLCAAFVEVAVIRSPFAQQLRSRYEALAFPRQEANNRK